METRWEGAGSTPWVARPWAPGPGLAPPWQPVPRRRGPLAWEAGGPAPSCCGLHLRPVRSYVANEGQVCSIRGGLRPHLAYQAGAGGQGMSWERVGCWSSSEADVTSMPWGHTERSCWLLSGFHSLRRRTVHPLLKEKRSRWPVDRSTTHTASCSPRPCLPWPHRLHVPLSPWRGPPCICAQDPIPLLQGLGTLAVGPWCYEGRVSAACLRSGAPSVPSAHQGLSSGQTLS